VLLTATRRLARALTEKFNSWQRDRGRAVWKTPHILPIEAYLLGKWNDNLVEGGGDSVLLNPTQEAVVWEEIVRASRYGPELLQTEAAARGAMEAWRLAQAYRIPLDGRIAMSEDCEAFLEWSREFERRLGQSNWQDAARVAESSVERRHGEEVFFTGFDKLTPQFGELLAAWFAQEVPLAERRSVIRTQVCDSAEDEIRCAAEWARQAIENDARARIGVAVLDLQHLRGKVERIFAEVLQPGAAPAAESVFHISLGRPLASYAPVHAALLILQLATGRMPLMHACTLLRSPYLRGGESEGDVRARLDLRLRQQGSWFTSADILQRSASASECRELSRALKTFSVQLLQTPAMQGCAGWSRTFSELLKAFGWPGDRPLNTQEHQIVARWNALLSEFAALDVTAGNIELAGAVERLRKFADATVFQFEDTGAPVQISDPGEMIGLEFDHLWVMGLHDEVFPAPASPNPFLPASLQREYGVPHSSAHWEFEAAKRTFGRLGGSASEVVFSYPRMEGDRMLAPSPFLAPAAVARPSFKSWRQIIWSASELEAVVDERAPALEGEKVQSGGVSLLRDVAACPFRAFAKHRLGARELEDIDAGLSAADRGKALHEALQLIWGEVGSRDRLLELSVAEEEEIVERHVAAAVDRCGSGLSAAVEKIRLSRLIAAWLQLERRRPPFTVVSREQKREIEIGGLRLEVRADRVDQLADGRQVIIDYKTGNVATSVWEGPRLDEPQVPLYYISSGVPVAGAAFARIRADRLGFLGMVENTVLPEFKPCSGDSAGWRAALVALAEQFRSGDARVDPKLGESTCDFCKITPLCRVRDERDDG